MNNKGFAKKIVITGAAGLVGQNLVLLLTENGYDNILAIDKHAHNLDILKQVNPRAQILLADLAVPGAWSDAFADADCVVILHAQITGKETELFTRNNIDATRHVLDAIKLHQVPFAVHISSSVVNSVADDDYTNTKKNQEKLVVESGVPYCVLRPTLMFGWFDPKHFGWLSRFMEKSPIFPIPGDGKYMRQPLYNRDFCRAILWCIKNRPSGKIYDIVGETRIDYVDIIRAIKRVKGLQTWIVPIPYWLFYALLKIYALFSKHPPFTADQLKALTAGDEFVGVDVETSFGFKPTPFEDAIRESYSDPRYSHIVVQR